MNMHACETMLDTLSHYIFPTALSCRQTERRQHVSNMSPQGWEIRAIYQQTLNYKSHVFIELWGSISNRAISSCSSRPMLSWEEATWEVLERQGTRRWGLRAVVLGSGRAVTCDRCVSGGKGQDVFRHRLGWSCACYNWSQNSFSVPGAHTDNQWVSDLRDLSDRVWLCSKCSFMCYFPWEMRPLGSFTPWIRLCRLSY